MSRVGIFSGTFDPVHEGHIHFCKSAMEAARLYKVVILPEPEPRAKPAATSLEHRYEMLKLATAQEPELEVMKLEGESRFTVAQTLPKLQKIFAGDELYLLIGSDVVPGLAKGWPGLKNLLEQMSLVVGMRDTNAQDSTVKALQNMYSQFLDLQPRVTFVNSPFPTVKSTDIRQDANVFGAVIPQIEEYITEHGLYVRAV